MGCICVLPMQMVNISEENPKFMTIGIKIKSDITCFRVTKNVMAY